MSYSYNQALKILTHPNRWEYIEDSDRYIVYQVDNTFQIAHLKQDGDKWYITDTVDNSMWFRSYPSAKLYIKNEWYVDGRFKRVKTE